MVEGFLGLDFFDIYDTDAFFGFQLLLTFLITYGIFKRMTGIKVPWTVIVTLILTNLTLQYNIPTLTSVADAAFLLILAVFVMRRQWTVRECLFYALFPAVTTDLLFRLLGLYILPLVFNLPLEIVGNNAFFYLLTYALIPLIYLLFDRYLGLDIKRWKAFNEDRYQSFKISREAIISMTVYLVSVYFYVHLGVWHIDIPDDLGLKLRMIWVLLFAIYFVLMIARMNRLSRSYLEEGLVKEQEHHLDSLIRANQKIDALYHELEDFRQSYEEAVTHFSVEDSGQGEALAERVYQNVLRESAKEFERFRMAEEPALDNIQSLPLRSLLSARLMEAKRAGISVTFDIPEPVSGFEINVVDLTLMLSIFFSNAIDESKQVLDGSIVFRLVKDEVEGSYRLVLENQTLEERVDLEEILQEENQKKLSGLNLHTARDILKKYPNLVLTTTSGDYRFKQVLVFN